MSDAPDDDDPRKKKHGGKKSGRDYEVGRGRPPVHTRWQPGQSGNPAGRKKGRRSIGSIVREELEKPIRVKNSRRKLPAKRVFVANELARALNGDRRAVNSFMALMRLVGELQPEPNMHSAEPLSSEDQRLIADLLRRVNEAPRAAKIESEDASEESKPERDDKT